MQSEAQLSTPPPSEAADPAERLHPFTLLFEALRVGRAFLLPALIAAFTAGRGDAGFGRIGALTLLFLAIPALIRAGVKYATFRYGVLEGDLVVTSGLLSRHRRTIPLSRIQNIDVRQSALQRLLGMGEVRVETASGDSADAELSVLPIRRASAVREELLRRRRGLQGAAAEEAPQTGEWSEASAPDRELIAKLSVRDLMILGATSNRAGLIAAGLFGLLQFVLQLGIDIPEPQVDPDAVVDAASGMMFAAIVTGVLLLFFLVGWLLSIITVTVEYYGFMLERTGGEVEKRYGLLSRRHASVPLHRVQTVRVEQSILRRPLDLAALTVESAGAELGQQQRGRVEAFLPLARVREVPRLVREVFPDCDLAEVALSPVHPRARLRAAVRYSVPVLLLTAGGVWWLGSAGLALLGLLALSLAGAHFFYRSLGYALHPEHVVARAGVWNRITWVVPYPKIQTLHVTETPFQRRQGLATLLIDTAAGGAQDGASIRDLAREDAYQLLEELHRRAQHALRVKGEGEGELRAPGAGRRAPGTDAPSGGSSVGVAESSDCDAGPADRQEVSPAPDA